MQIAISPQSLLRLIRRQGAGAIVCGRVIGIDDWAFAKRKRYGSLIVDLKAHQVVDVLPDRLADTVATWMKAHPGIEVVTRDRGENFIAGVTQGAPDAQQVADRWHLHHNLGEMLKRLVEGHLKSLHKLIQDRWRQQTQTQAQAEAQAPMPIRARFHKVESTDERDRRENTERYRQRHEMVHSLARQGKSRRAISRMTGLSRNTIKRILSTPEFQGVAQRGSHHSSIDPYRDFLAGRLAQGCYNALQLFKEIKAQGFTGSYSTVWHLVRGQAFPMSSASPASPEQHPQPTPSATTATAQQPSPSLSPRPTHSPIPSTFDIIRWLLNKVHNLTSVQIEVLQAWLEATPAVKAGRDAAQRFTEILTKRQTSDLADALNTWIADATVSTVSCIKQFGKGIKADYDAVLAALQLQLSNAQLEGQVNRLKLIKRQMYGRAKFDLLKIRVMTKV